MRVAPCRVHEAENCVELTSKLADAPPRRARRNSSARRVVAHPVSYVSAATCSADGDPTAESAASPNARSRYSIVSRSRSLQAGIWFVNRPVCQAASLDGPRLQPLDADEVLTQLGIVGVVGHLLRLGERRLEDRHLLAIDLDLELGHRPRLLLDDADADVALDRIGLVEEDARAGEQPLERLRPERPAARGDEAVAVGVLPRAIADRDVEVAPVPGRRRLAARLPPPRRRPSARRAGRRGPRPPRPAASSGPPGRAGARPRPARARRRSGTPRRRTTDRRGRRRARSA